MQPAARNSRHIHNQLLQKRLTVKRHYDKSSRPLQPLQEGQSVRMQTERGYDKLGTVTEVRKEPRSYNIQANGKTYRRNRRHILPVAEPAPPLLQLHDPEFQDASSPPVGGTTHTHHTRHTCHTPEHNTPSPWRAASSPSAGGMTHTHHMPMPNSPSPPSPPPAPLTPNLPPQVPIQHGRPYTTRSGRTCKPNPKYL